MKVNKIVLVVLLVVLSFAGCNVRRGGTTGGTSFQKFATQEEWEAAYRAEPASQRVINIGFNGGLCQAAVAIAQHKGYFSAEGLRTELTRSDEPRDAISGGKIDTSAGMIAGWLKPITNGIDLRFTVGLHTDLPYL